MIILVDDEYRENEGDLVVAAECVTPQTINFMIRNACGRLCLAMNGEITGGMSIAWIEAALDALAMRGSPEFRKRGQPYSIGPALDVVSFHIYEGARAHGVRRVVFASSNHVTGFYPQGQVISEAAPMRPDGYYGLSKAFGENLARFYFDRYGIQTVCIRIGSSFPEPKDRRMLITWMSYRDLTELVRCALFAETAGYTVLYGVSDNRDHWWDNGSAAFLGFHPQDSSEVFRPKVEAQPAPDPADPASRFQGGAFVKAGPYET